MAGFAEAMEGICRGEIWVWVGEGYDPDEWFELEPYNGTEEWHDYRHVQKCWKCTDGTMMREDYSPNRYHILEKEWCELGEEQQPPKVGNPIMEDPPAV